jgi:Family of unknown function (DUF5689)
MKLDILKSLFFVTITSLFLSCVGDETYNNVSQEVPTFAFTPTTTVATLDLATTTTPTTYLLDDIIEAYVTSNDASGNFYKSISFQDVQTGSTVPVGFSLSLDQTMLFQKGYFPGRKVYIKLKGLAIAKVFGSMKIGLIDPTDPTQISNISGSDFQKYLFPSATIVDESTLVRHVSLAAAAADPIQNTLIEIDNIQFSDSSLGKSFFDASLNSAGLGTNHDMVDVTLGGRARFCRISKFAPFSINKTPVGRGSIRGVMSKYNSDFQFTVRNESDFKLTNARTYNFPATISENFNSFPVSSSYNSLTSFTAFPSYLNFITAGTKKWYIKTGGFLEMSAFSGNVENNKAYFVVPVDMTAANNMKFDIKVGFFTGQLGLKVYRTTDYVPGMNINDATLADITTAFNLPSASTTVFATSGTYNIPANVVGNGYFVFEYTGTNISTGPPVTTTINIDNIVVN